MLRAETKMLKFIQKNNKMLPKKVQKVKNVNIVVVVFFNEKGTIQSVAF